MQTKKRAKPAKFGSAEPQLSGAKQNSDHDSKKLKEDREEENDIEKGVKSKQKTHEDAELEKTGSVTRASSKIDDEESRNEVESTDSNEPEEDQREKKKIQSEEREEKDQPEGSESVSESEAEKSQDEESLLEKNGAFFSKPPDQLDEKKSMAGYFFLVAFVTFILGLTFFAGIYYAVSHRGELLSVFSQPTPTPKDDPTEAPTEKPVDLSLYSIRVLNGTETAGLAAKVRDELEAVGFNVVSVGNAASDDFEKTQIEALKNVDKAFVDKLKETLEKSYEVGDVKTQASASADVVVTIGSASAK